MKNLKFDFDDILISPAKISNISSRSEVKTTDEYGYLPLFTAPMDTVVCDDNIEIFKQNKIRTIKPRRFIKEIKDEELESYFDMFLSFGIDDFYDIFIKNGKLTYYEKYYILIDIANGHMERLLNLTIEAKKLYGDSLILMVGNIANPETYKIFSEAGADIIRLGIGNGISCLTTQHTGIGYPMGSLIKECYDISCEINKSAKIIADGGIKNYADIIKALALGADYVMIGSVFNKALESAGDTYLANNKKDGYTEPGDKIDQYSIEAKKLFQYGTKMFKKFRGMSTKEAQRSMGKDIIKTSEGINRMQPVEYTLNGWIENFNSYLSSAMSYTGAIDLDYFSVYSNIIFITNNALIRYRK